jgi:hypothetical protein
MAARAAARASAIPAVTPASLKKGKSWVTAWAGATKRSDFSAIGDLVSPKPDGFQSMGANIAKKGSFLEETLLGA